VNLSISHSRIFIKILSIHILLNMLLIAGLSYNYHGGYDSDNRKSPISYMAVLEKFLFSKEKIEKFDHIYRNQQVFEMLYQRYIDDLEDIIKTTDKKVLMLYLPYGENAQIHKSGADLIKNSLKNLNNSNIQFIDIFSEVFNDYDSYRVTESDGHPSKEANVMIADAIIKNYFNKYQPKISSYVGDAYKNSNKIKCFFPPQIDVDKGAWSVRTNSNGCRMDKEIDELNLKNNYRVILLGDSVVVPWSVDIEDGFPNLLEEKIDNLFIINIGKNSTSLKKMKNFIEEYNQIIQPDLIILQTQIGSIANYFYSVPFNRSDATKEEIEIENQIYNKLRFHMLLIFLLNTIIFFILYFLLTPKTQVKNKEGL